MNGIHILFVIFWMTISHSVSLTWSSSINGLFSGKTFMWQTVGVSNELVDSVGLGAQLAMDQCKNVFKWDRWNCPESAFSKRNKQVATREQAVVHAIVSAGLVHAITRNCSLGELKGCGCDSKLRGRIPANTQYITENGIKLPASYRQPKKTKIEWSWSGCSDDIAFGERITKTILDDLEVGKDTHAYANLHNLQVGRLLIRDTMVKRCRCHGISGSCALQTCWMQVAPFVKIANTLRKRYKKARRIGVQNRANVFTSSSGISEKHPKISPRTLVFIEPSPDYCNANNTTGWPGTQGRSCSRSRTNTTSRAEKKSCRQLCRKCGLRVRKRKQTTTVNCNCEFRWCCEIRCDKCTKTVEEFFCD